MRPNRAPSCRLFARAERAAVGTRKPSLRGIWDHCVEGIFPMPEGASLPAIGSGVSLFDLAWHASFVVQIVMAGLLSGSVWVWAIAIDKVFLYSRTRRAMDRFEQAFWSGESIEELYRALAAKPTQSMAACFVAAMREWKRSFESHARSFGGLQMRIEKVMNVSIAREIERLERRLLGVATFGSAGPLFGLVWNVWGVITR